MMKPILSALLVLSAVFSLQAATPIDSSIAAATVYLDRAVVTRTAAIDLAQGEQELVFKHLPFELLDDSLQVTGHGAAAVTILEVTAKTEWLNTAPNASIRDLEAEAKGLQQQRRVITDRSATLDQQQTLLTQIATDAAKPPPAERNAAATPPMNTAAWSQLLEFYTTGLEKIAAEKRTLDDQRDDLDSRITALNEQLAQGPGTGAKEVKNVVVRVSAEQAGKLTLTLAYTVPGAHWMPAYDARLSSSNRKLSLGYFGIVGQGTGEDWKGIELTLSTARPSLGGAAPELLPWIVAEQEPAAAMQNDVVVLSPFVVDTGSPAGYAGKRSLGGTGINRNLKDIAGATSAVTQQFLEDTSVRQQTAALDARVTSATFRIPGLTDIPSDNAPHKVGIATVPLIAELAYQSAPKLLSAAFLGAAATNSSDYPLLNGSISAFLDGMFVGQTRLKTVMPGEKLDLAFGADDGIHVERKLVNRFTEEVGLVTRQIRVTYDVLITVTNNKTSAAKITLKDQIPLSRHEKIEVEQLEPNPNETKPNDEGVLAWMLDLKPGEKRELSLKFSVTYPKDFPVSGLE
jgi:uncharacterized protein (TIGR02231 family)